MTLGTDRFREQLVDYLYGELEGQALREFEESLRASEQYRSELATMRETLRLSREGLGLLRERDQAPPPRVSRAVLAAAAGERARPEGAQPEPASPTRVRGLDLQHGERHGSSFWSFLRTPWLLPTLGVAAAVSVVVLHKQVESPKMSEYQPPTAQHPAGGERAPVSGPSRLPAQSAEPGQAEATAAGSGGAPSEGFGSVQSAAKESKRDQAPAAQGDPAQVRSRARFDGAEQARAAPRKAARQDSPSAKGYAVPPAQWAGRDRAESAKKELAEGPAAGSSGAALEQREELEAPPARDLGSDGFVVQAEGRVGAGVAAAKPAARARSTNNQAEPAPSAPVASAPADDFAAGGAPPSSAARPRTELSRAPDEAVKVALEHMNARRFGQAAVAYRELLQRYPRDSRAPFFRSQLSAALAALSNVDAIR